MRFPWQCEATPVTVTTRAAIIPELLRDDLSDELGRRGSDLRVVDESDV